MFRNRIISFVKKNKLILLIWLLGLFCRIYRLDELLSFHYDQGRDALIVQDIINFKNFPAIGPTTGIKGLHLGPFWFYLITPGYLIGQGSPAVAAAFIAFFESLSIPLLYFLLKKYHRKTSAYLVAILWAFSRYIIHSARWFSNPTPIPTLVLLLIFFLAEIYIHRKQKYWPWVALLLGLSLQLEAASAVFFIPVIGLVFLLSLKKTKQKITWPITSKQFLLSLSAFFALLIPQLLFEIKNNFLITGNFFAFLTGRTNTITGKSWALPTLEFITGRVGDYYQIFMTKLDTNLTSRSTIFLVIFLLGLYFLYQKRKKLSPTTRKFFLLISLWLFVPLLLLLFFVGNYGKLYDYYLTGFFPAFFLLFAVSVTTLIKKHTLLFSVLVVFFFLSGNAIHLYNSLIAGTDGPAHISLGNKQEAIDFICENSQGKNLEIYSPLSEPLSYNYLINQKTSKKECSFSSEETRQFFILAENNPDFFSNLENWLAIKSSYSSIQEETRFGGIIVQERIRHE